MYKLKKQLDTETFIIIKTDNNTSFLQDLANTDYQAYLKWVDEGGITEPADE